MGSRFWQKNVGLFNMLLTGCSMLIGVWATLQFKWIQLQYPVVCLAFERLLFAATPPVAAMILTWGTLAAVGPAHAPFYQAVLLSGETLNPLSSLR